MAEIIRRTAFSPDTAAYLDYGTVEMENHADMQRYFWETVTALAEKGIGVARTYVGEFVTSLEMEGFSISLLRLDDELKELLFAPADTPAFKEL